MTFTRRALLTALAAFSAVPASAEALESEVLYPATSHNFGDLVIAAQEPVLLYVWAPWCSVCRRTTPQLQKTALALREQVTFATLNYDDAPALARQMNVRGVPTLLLFRQGNIRGSRSGFISADRLENWILARL